MSSKPIARRIAGGFTLIELVVVLAILAALAGLIIPRVDFLKTSAESASGAAGMEETFSNLQLFKTVKGFYPHQYDSLLGTDAAVYGKIFNHGTPWMTPLSVDPASATSFLYASLVHGIESNSAGDLVLFDHSLTSTDYSNSATVARTIDGTAAFNVAELTSASIKAKLYPGGVPAGVRLIAFGIGPKCTAVGTTMAAPAQCAGVGSVSPATHYCRYVAVFAASETVMKCQLKAVIDPLGNDVVGRLKGYYTSTPE